MNAKKIILFYLKLITNPNLLFCDEPTSGLDSFMALSLVESMRDLADQGKTIICTIHQPSSAIFEKFDRLCLLAEGRLAFIGGLNEAKMYFARWVNFFIYFYLRKKYFCFLIFSQNYFVPNNYNPADYYIATLAVVPSNADKSKKVIKVNFLIFILVFLLIEKNLLENMRHICGNEFLCNSNRGYLSIQHVETQ